MSASKIVYSRLSLGATGDSGAVVSPRQQFQTRPNNVPYVVYYKNQTRPNGTKLTTSVIDTESIIVECYAKDYDAAKDLAALVRQDLDRIPHGVYAGVLCDGSHFTNEYDPEYDDTTELYDVQIEFEIRVKRAGLLPSS